MTIFIIDRPETTVAHEDRGIDDLSDIAPAIHQTAPFRAASDDEFAEMSSAPRHPRNYTRDGNPTFKRVESIIATLEGAEAALLTSSGMGAINTSVLSLVGQGNHVIAQKTHYMGTAQLLSTVLPRFGVSVTLVDQMAPAAFANAITPATKLIVVETPANPLLTLTDLASVAELARSRGIVTPCDSTIATPINQTPARFGIDLVVHSATNFLGGHHDLMAGVVVGPRLMVERIWHCLAALGPVPDPFAAWLLLRASEHCRFESRVRIRPPWRRRGFSSSIRPSQWSTIRDLKVIRSMALRAVRCRGDLVA